jgi:hypothetical protein
MAQNSAAIKQANPGWTCKKPLGQGQMNEVVCALQKQTEEMEEGLKIQRGIKGKGLGT